MLIRRAISLVSQEGIKIKVGSHFLGWNWLYEKGKKKKGRFLCFAQQQQLKKHDLKKLRIYVDVRGLNKVTLTNPFPTPFTEKIIKKLARHECYSFIDGFLGYN
jgi:hypothetical protein